MANLTQVGLTTGVPTSGTGNVSTLDAIFDSTNGPVAIKPPSTPATTLDRSFVVQVIGQNPNGSAPSTGSTPTVIATDQSTLAVAFDVTKVLNAVSGTALTPTSVAASANTSGVTTIVAATPGKHIKVLSWSVSVNAAVNFKWQSSVTPTDLTGLFYGTTNNSFFPHAFNPVGHFQTLSSEALNINLSGAVAVGISLVYVLV